MADGVVDVATSVYVLHELPAEIRRRWAGELGRVVAAGGLLLVVDSLQFGDHPPYDRMIEGFPRSFHEPFYDAYARTDLTELFAAAGFRAVAAERAFLSKVMVFERDAGRD
jgi:SAM-dependent methyltransferase